MQKVKKSLRQKVDKESHIKIKVNLNLKKDSKIKPKIGQTFQPNKCPCHDLELIGGQNKKKNWHSVMSIEIYT